MADQIQTTRPLTDKDWLYWQKLVSDEHDRQDAEIKLLRRALDKITRRYPAGTVADMRRLAAEALGFKLSEAESDA